MFDFAFAAPGRTEAEFDLFNGRGQSHHVYTAGGRERIKTPIGDFDSLRFMRGRDPERTEIWLAPELGMLPVKITVLEKDGTRYEQVATKITPP